VKQAKPDIDRPAGIRKRSWTTAIDVRPANPRFQADLTRVRPHDRREVVSARYPRFGIRDAITCSRTIATTASSSKRSQRINTHHVQLFSDLYVKKMKSIAEGEGSLLQKLHGLLRQRPELRATATAPLTSRW